MAHPRIQATRWLSRTQQPDSQQPDSQQPDLQKPQQGHFLQSDMLQEELPQDNSSTSVSAEVPANIAGRAAAKLLPPASPAPLREAEQLWVALLVPTLWLTAATRVRSPHAPLVILGLKNRVQRVIAADTAARERGIAPGLSLASALALCPQLDARERNLRLERVLLDELAANALNFTPRVSLERPDALLLEVKGSLGLFGGVEPLCEAVLQSCQQRGVPVQLALAPTPLAALAGARAGRSFKITHMAQLVGELATAVGFGMAVGRACLVVII